MAGGPEAIDTSASDARRAVILTADKFEDMEVFVPLFRLTEEGWHMDVAAPTLDAIGGEHGYGLKPTKTIDQVNPDESDLLLIPGRFPEGVPATVRKIKHAQEIARSWSATGKPVASNCHGPWTLVSVDLVRGRRLTSYWHDGVPQEIQRAEGTWEDEEVVLDGNLVTSRHPMDLPAFCREMLKVARKASWAGLGCFPSIGYGWGTCETQKV